VQAVAREVVTYLAGALLAVLALPPVAMAQAPGQIPLTLGFANLAGTDAVPLVDQDKAALGPLFKRVAAPEPTKIPAADVLFLYVHLNPDGTMRGTKSGVRQVVELTKAKILVVASPNPSESITKAVALPGPKTANMVFTLDRRGSNFTRFFRGLFERRHGGQDMLLAWVELAPQGPNQSSDLPATILVTEAGRLALPK
jgi:hypothetical protein